MTEDPIKLYVVVMSILVAVLGWVAQTSWKQASAFEQAVEQAPGHAKSISQLTAEVDRLCEQLSKSKLRTARHKTLIEDAVRDNGIDVAGLGEEPNPKPIGSKGLERRFFVEIRRSGTSRPVTRERVARFCRQVEQDSRGILKTIEIRLTRDSSADGVPAGRDGTIVDDTYTGTIVFGLRVVKNES